MGTTKTARRKGIGFRWSGFLESVSLSPHQPQLIFTIIYFGWRLPIKTLVGSFIVVKIKVFFQGLAQLFNRSKFIYINFFILHTAPQPLDENIVDTPAFSIHTDFNVLIFQYFCKLVTCVLRSLIRVEYIGCSMTSQCALQRGSMVIDSSQERT